MEHFGRAIEAKRDFAEAHFNRSEIMTFHGGDAELNSLEMLARTQNLDSNKAHYLHFALAKALEDTGDFARAFQFLKMGNNLKRRQIRYDEPGTLGMLERISKVFDRALLQRLGGQGHPSPTPVFVLGMPRSGSTLIEQILASHPQVHGAGELNHIEKAANMAVPLGGDLIPYPECVAAFDPASLARIGRAYIDSLPAVAQGKIRIIDKAPGNFMHIGLIRLILPNARIIHTTRNPVDTCLSCYSKLFSSGLYFTYDLEELGRFYRGYRKLMSHWRRELPPGAMHEVSYEEVVRDLEGQARRIIDYCGLPWDGRCIEFHKTVRTVKTASAVQVRKPLFNSSIERWRKHASELAPLLRELGDIASENG